MTKLSRENARCARCHVFHRGAKKVSLTMMLFGLFYAHTCRKDALQQQKSTSNQQSNMGEGAKCFLQLKRWIQDENEDSEALSTGHPTKICFSASHMQLLIV